MIRSPGAEARSAKAARVAHSLPLVRFAPPARIGGSVVVDAGRQQAMTD
jgi:hypothetical protein